MNFTYPSTARQRSVYVSGIAVSATTTRLALAVPCDGRIIGITAVSAETNPTIGVEVAVWWPSGVADIIATTPNVVESDEPVRLDIASPPSVRRDYKVTLDLDNVGATDVLMTFRVDFIAAQ